MKMLSLVKLPIPCGYQKGEGRGRKKSQGFRKRPMGTCRPFQNGRLLIFRFLKFFTSVCDSLVLVNVKFKTATIFKFLAHYEMIKLVKIVWVLKLGISLDLDEMQYCSNWEII